MTIEETLAEMLSAQWAMVGELRAIRAVLEGPASEAQPDLERLTREASSATDLVRAGVLRRHR